MGSTSTKANPASLAKRSRVEVRKTVPVAAALSALRPTGRQCRTRR